MERVRQIARERHDAHPDHAPHRRNRPRDSARRPAGPGTHRDGWSEDVGAHVGEPERPVRRADRDRRRTTATTTRASGDTRRAMIVRTFPDRLELITQPDHARLARAIMDHCVPLARPASARCDSAGHLGTRQRMGRAGRRPIVNPATGEPCSISSAPHPACVRPSGRGVSPRSRAIRGPRRSWRSTRSRCNDRFRPDGEWTPFFEAMEAARAALLRSAGLPLGDLAWGLRLRPARRFDFAGVLLRRDRRAAVRRIHGQAPWHACGRDARRLRRGGRFLSGSGQESSPTGRFRRTMICVAR